MNDKPKCETCRFWTLDEPDGEGHYGECRRNPPVIVLSQIDPDENGYMGGCGVWPFTRDDEWCGEHQPE